jgi:hypothetical protein
MRNASTRTTSGECSWQRRRQRNEKVEPMRLEASPSFLLFLAQLAVRLRRVSSSALRRLLRCVSMG